ncbi:ankyrin repeat domain-containing protein 31 [Lathamus discolor]|uniref:ankyrin repeat domain-containing protein 31 n=1 Tax=Lathamus discolor TaxID=678569 RepID=UPI0032B7442C
MEAASCAEGSRAARRGRRRQSRRAAGSGAGMSGGGEDSSSDETLVEASVPESDVDEEEFLWRRRLPFLSEDVHLRAETRIHKGIASPEICFIPKFCDHTYSQKQQQINPVFQEAYTSDQSQSLLQGWIKYPSLTENISESVFKLNAAVEGHQNNSVDIELNGFQKVSEEKISQKLNEDLSPDVSVCLDVLEDMIMVPNEQTSQHTFPYVLEDCQGTCMTPSGMDNTVKEHSHDDDTHLSLTSVGKIFMEAFSELNIDTSDLEITDLLGSLSDSENLKMINPLPDYLGHFCSIDSLADESSDALPVELVTALNAMSGSPIVPNEIQLNIEEEQLNSEPSILQLGDDCTQITNRTEPQLAKTQMEEIKALRGSDLQRTTNEQPVGDQQREKEVTSNNWGAACSEKQTVQGIAHLVNAPACAEAAQTTSKKAMHEIHESTSEDKQDLETNIHQEITPNEDSKVKQRRRSKRIKNKLSWTALHTASVEGSHRIANELLKAGADVDARGYEQVTPLQDAAKEGHYEMAELLLFYGADPLLKNEMGRCALEEASDPAMKKLLKSYVAKYRINSVAGGDAPKNMLNAESVEDTNLHQISLQTDESEPACANCLHSDSADILQQTIVNEVQNIYTDISGDGTSCTEQTVQANAETLLVQECLAATNGGSVSGNPCDSTDSVLSSAEPKASQSEGGGRILFNAEESVEGCRIETENVSSLRMEPITLQLREKQIIQKRSHETSSKADLHFGVNVDSRSPYSFQIVENMQKETSQKADEVFAQISGTKGSEKNGDKVNAKISMLLEFTETGIQRKRIRLDPQETNKKAASYSSSSKTDLSSKQSRFSQGADQQTSKKSGAGRKLTNKRTAKGETQLHVAARRGNLSLVKTLISSGICVNEQDSAGWTAIHEASNRGFIEVILELLKAGANVNSRNLDGILPIHCAVSGNYLEAVRVLLQHGANPCERSNSGKSALDEAHDDEMSELLRSYCAMDSLPPVDTIEVTGMRDPSRSRRSKYPCNSNCENYNADLEPQCEKYSVEPVAAIQDAEKRQKELLLLELRTSKDADTYIQKLSQVQDTLNEMLAKQKAERDTLAKKYRASAESFKKGPLRKQLVNLASRQKSLLTVAQNQEKLVQKIQNYRKTKQVFSAPCSEKQISNSIISHGDDERRSLTADEIVCPYVVTFSMGLGASMPNGNRVEAHLPLENRFPAQDCSQHPHICLNETGENKEAIRSKEAFDHALASESRVREYPFDSKSKLTNAVEVVTLPSEPTVSTAKSKYSQQADIDCVAIAEQGNKSLNPTSVTNVLNIIEPQSTVVNNNVCQPGSNCQQVLAVEGLQRYMNGKEAFQQQQQQRIILSKSTKNFPNTLQQMIWSAENSFNANLVLPNHTSNTDYPVNLSEKASQSYSNQECEQIQVKCGRRNKKKFQLIDLLELGKIKPGENVLEFKLQELSHKATLLNNGKIRTRKGQIMQNPVHWVKDLLGNDIYVTWKYAWNKVTYLGTQLSKFLDEGVSVSEDPELPSQERMSLGSSVQFNSVERLAHFLQFHDIVMVPKEEFLPCTAMEKYWNFYKGCKDFGF